MRPGHRPRESLEYFQFREGSMAFGHASFLGALTMMWCVVVATVVHVADTVLTGRGHRSAHPFRPGLQEQMLSSGDPAQEQEDYERDLQECSMHKGEMYVRWLQKDRFYGCMAKRGWEQSGTEFEQAYCDLVAHDASDVNFRCHEGRLVGLDQGYAMGPAGTGTRMAARTGFRFLHASAGPVTRSALRWDASEWGSRNDRGWWSALVWQQKR